MFLILSFILFNKVIFILSILFNNKYVNMKIVKSNYL